MEHPWAINIEDWKLTQEKQVRINSFLGKDKTYKAPEFFGYDNYSFYDIEVGVVGEGKRCPQPESGLTEYW